MSNLSSTTERPCDLLAASDAIELLLHPRHQELGGFTVRRVLPTAQRKMVGPWIFFDHMGPTEFAAGSGIDVRPHPHINLATVTYLFEGEILHRDSLGNVQPIRPGDINLMVAGRGIVHSERERPELRRQPHRLHGLQLWLALPADQEEIEPAFYHYPSASIPTRQVNGVPVRVIMGSAYGVSSPVKTFAETLYLEADLKAGQTLTLPFMAERAIYLARGELEVQGSPLPEHSLAVCAPLPQLTLAARADARIAVIGGEAFEQRFIEWNFVSTRKERIAQAREDWRQQRFATIPGDDQEFIPLPD